MSVYVDTLREWGWVMRGRIIPSCHLLADTEQELHAFAGRLGLKRAWYQPRGTCPHYDLTEGKRNQALALGAVHLEDNELVAAMHRLRGLIAQGGWHEKEPAHG